MPKITLAMMKAKITRSEASIQRQEALITRLIETGYNEMVTDATAYVTGMQRKLALQLDVIGRMKPD